MNKFNKVKIFDANSRTLGKPQKNVTTTLDGGGG